jgi:hypothetical protein
MIFNCFVCLPSDCKPPCISTAVFISFLYNSQRFFERNRSRRCGGVPAEGEAEARRRQLGGGDFPRRINS